MARLKRRTRNIISIILVTLLTFGVGFGIYSIASVKTKTISSTIFDVGSIDDTGIHKVSKTTLYTKDMFECQGLKIQRDFESTANYNIYYYDVAGDYLGKDACKDEYYDIANSVYSTARYCRIVILPQDGKEIGFFEKYSIANQFKITVNKKQDYTENNKLSLNENGDYVLKTTTENSTTYKYANNGKLIACKPINVTTANKSAYYKRLVILSSYVLTEEEIYVANGKLDASGTSVNKKLLSKTDESKDYLSSGNTTDGLYYYTITFTSDDFASSSTDYYVIFNFLRNQEQPQVYLYLETAFSSGS